MILLLIIIEYQIYIALISKKCLEACETCIIRKDITCIYKIFYKTSFACIYKVCMPHIVGFFHCFIILFFLYIDVYIIKNHTKKLYYKLYY